MARLRSDFWVSAYLRLCSIEGIPAVLRRRGDEEAGGIFIKVDHMNQQASLYGPAAVSFREDDGERKFCIMVKDAFPFDIEERIEREVKFDSDLWLLEVDCAGELKNIPLESSKP